jgi:hypothetical protein
MANTDAWNEGWATGQNRAAHRRERKDMLSDEERQQKTSMLVTNAKGIADSLPNLAGDDLKNAQSKLEDIDTELQQIYHPDNNPGALQKDVHLLMGLIHKGKPAPTPAVISKTVEPGTPAATVELPGQDITLPATQSPTVKLGGWQAQYAKPGAAVTKLDPATEKAFQEWVQKNKIPSTTDSGKPDPTFAAADNTYDMRGYFMAWKHGKVKPDGTFPETWKTPSNASFSGESQYALPTAPKWKGNQLIDSKGNVVFDKDAKAPTAPAPSAPVTISTGPQTTVLPATAPYVSNVAAKLSAMTPQQQQGMKRRDAAHKEMEQQTAAAGLTQEQQTALEGRKTLAYIQSAITNYKMGNPNATPQQITEFTSDLYANIYGTKQKAVWKEYVSADGKSKTYLDLNRPDSIPPGWNATGGGKPAVGMKYDTSTGQIEDRATGQRYVEGDASNPPEVAQMFVSARKFMGEKQAFQEEMMKLRGESYGSARQMAPMVVLDTYNDGAVTAKSFQEMEREPGRYVPAHEGDLARQKGAMFQDIQNNVDRTGETIKQLKAEGGFTPEMQAKILVAMRAEDPENTLAQMLATGALGELTPTQRLFMIRSQQLAENAMVMRGILGAGQGSDDVRRAIQRTLPSLLGPDTDYAEQQLEAFNNTLINLHLGVNKIALNADPRTPVGGGGKPGTPGKPIVPGSKGPYSLAAAMKLPFNKGKSEAVVGASLIKNGYLVAHP